MKVMTVWISHPDREKALMLLKHLVTENLAACGHVFDPGSSIYRWKGSVVQDSEVMILLKTGDQCQEKLVAEVTRLHPYEVPEIIFQQVDGGSSQYLSWVMESVLDRDPDRNGDG